MTTPPSVQPLPRERAKDKYDVLNEQRYRSQVDEELQYKHDKRSNLQLGRGKTLVLSSPSGTAYALGLSDDGLLTVTDYATGIAGELIIDWEDINGALFRDEQIAALSVSVEEFPDNYATISSLASVETSLETSIATLETELTASVGGVQSQVANIAQAYATNNAATARLLWQVNAGTNVATIIASAANGFSDGTWNGAAIKLAADLLELLAKDINFGTKTTFEDTYGTIYTVDGGERVRMLGPFPASGDLLLWAGPTSVSLNSETYSNGYISLSKSNGLWLGPPAVAAGVSANYYEQSTDPGSVANGSWWFKTTTSELYFRRSGSWGLVATIAAASLVVTPSTSSLSAGALPGNTATTGSVTFSVTGGTSPYTWRFAGGTYQPSTVSGAGTPTPSLTFSKTISASENSDNPATIQFFDANGKSGAATISINFFDST